MGNSISNAGEAIIELVVNLTPELLTMCRKSTPWYNEERMNQTLREWYTEAKLLGISKEMPILRIMATGIKAPQQESFDSCYDLHGSNGTYVENANPEWILKIRLRRLDFAVDESEKEIIHIHQYITQKLMPRLGWGKITAGRLDLLNDVVKNHTLKVVTREMDVAPIYRRFLPVDFSCWENALDTIFSDGKLV